MNSAAPGAYKRLLDKINRHDVADAIREATRPMQRWFDWEHGGLPFFRNTMEGERPNIGNSPQPPLGNGHHPSYSLSHVAGRWLDALLNAEAVIGIEVDPKAEANLRHWLVQSMSHPIGLPACLRLDTYEVIPVSDLHNLREVMHGLAALCEFRNDQECEAIGERLIAVIDEYLDFETGRWDEARYNRERGGYTFDSPPSVVEAAGWDKSRHVEGLYFPQHFGRYLGALMRFYKATGSPRALDQAVRLRNHMMAVTFADPTRYDVKLLGGHTHSVTSAMSGLARFAAATADHEVFDRIEAMLTGLVADIATDFGWCTENWFRNDDYGEINNSADIAETLLLLGQAGRTRHYQAAEGVVRSHILPSQLRDTSFIRDVQPNLASWSEGAFGFPCPYGVVQEAGGWISYNWDIVGGGTAGLCEVLRLAVTRGPIGGLISINTPFDGRFGDISIVSPYAPGSFDLRISAHADCSVRLHLSDWNTSPSVRPVNGAAAATASRAGDWLYISGLASGDEIAVDYELAERRRDYTLKTGTLTATWSGDAITAMDTGFDPPLRFMPSSGATEATT